MSDAVLESALRTLAPRDHSEAELRRKLSGKGFADGDIDATLQRLRELNYLDDRRFARAFAESAIRNGRGYGAKLKQELARRGVSGGLIAEVLSELGEEYEEQETLGRLLERKFPGFQVSAATEKEKRRVVGYLQRRGFSLSAIMAQLKAEQAD